MREIVYKNLTGKDNKKNLSIRELVSKDGVLARIERKCTYFIRDKVYVEDPNDIEPLKMLKDENSLWKKKHFHIIRKHDSYTGEDSLACKVAGNFYAIVGKYIFSIAYVHSFKMELAVVAIGKELI